MGKGADGNRRFVHLHTHSPFSFLDGATDIESLVRRAAELDQPALACTDHDNVSAAVRFQKAAMKAGLAPIQGAEVTLEDGSHLILLADGPPGYAALCRCLTASHLGNARQEPRLSLDVLAKEAPGHLIALSGCRRGRIPSAVLRGDREGAMEGAKALGRCFAPGDFFLELEGAPLPGTRGLNAALAELGERLSLPLVATNNVHYQAKEDFPVHDLLTCVRTLTRVDDVHPERRLNAENYLKSGEEMAEVFGDYPEALDHAAEVAARCRPALVLEKSLFPAFQSPDGVSSADYLRQLVYEGAAQRYGKVTGSVRQRLDHELDIITRLGFEDYFLLVWDVAAFARRRGIRYAGRGSAADSAVAYCLFITDVDSIRRGLLFERFLSMERAEKPDIDIDFDSRRRDEATRYVYEKYGASRVATVATYNTFHARSAIRDFGKAMGLPEEDVDALAKRVPYYYANDLARAFEAVPEIRDAGLPLHKFQAISKACAAVSGFPRFLGTHLGGVVICREDLTSITPLQMSAKGVVVTQFDKDDVEDLGLVKLDLLCLRTLGAVDDAVRSIGSGERAGAKGHRFDYDRIPQGDRDTYRMINRGETIGVFQLESPAQRALQSRLRADNFEDLVASVAIIRPGPIKGNMVEPFIARRQGREPVTYLHPKLEPILGKTFGVVLFQEQVIEIATAIAGFSPGDADRLRRVMSHGRSFKEMQAIGEEFVERAVALGVERAVADQIFASMAGYASYGFCEAHAAAFANTAYKTAYLVRHYPAEFFAAILSNQPMGYYPTQTLAVEARRRGVGFLPLDVNKSSEAFGVERLEGGRKAIRLSLKQVKGMTAASLEAILQVRGDRKGGPFASLEEFCLRVGRLGGLERDVVENLIRAGAFDSLEPNRKALLWRLDTAVAAARAVLASDGQGFFLAPPATAARRPSGAVPADFSPHEKFIMEYDLLGINSGGHFMQFFRDKLAAKGYRSTKEVRSVRPGTRVKIAGFAVRPHRPPTKSGKTIVFLSLEDEFGLADVTIFEHIYQRFGKFIFSDPAPPLVIWGKVERRGLAAAIIAEKIAEFTPAP